MKGGADKDKNPPSQSPPPLSARKTAKNTGRCAVCGAPLVQPDRPGRRREFCGECARPAVAARRWREANREAVAARNEARRVSYPAKPCEQCGQMFVPPRSDSRHCTPICRDRSRGRGLSNQKENTDG